MNMLFNTQCLHRVNCILAIGTLLLVSSTAFAQVKISALPSASSQTGTEVIPEYQAGSCPATGGTCGATVSQISSYVYSLLPASNQTITGTWNFTGTLQSSGVSVLQANTSAVLALWTGTCSASTVLFGNGACNAVTVAAGGTGVTTLTGLVKGNGTSPFTAASSANVLALWTGSCNAGTLLFGNGTCNAVSLTSNVSGTLPVTSGGTGASTLTGLIKGTGTTPFTAASASDVITLWTGTCSSSTYLRADGQCITPAGAVQQMYATIGVALGSCSLQTSYDNSGFSSCTYNGTTFVTTVTFSFAFAHYPTCTVTDGSGGAQYESIQANSSSTSTLLFKAFNATGTAVEPGLVSLHCF